MALRNIKLTIHYDGSAYHGWQIQPSDDTIEAQVTNAIEKLAGKLVKVTGSSRTDAGVSALGQVANFKIDTCVPTANMAKALTQLLPDDIAVVSAEDVPDDFNAIRDTKSKLYRYSICNDLIPPVIRIKHCWHWPGKLDVANMNTAAAVLIGKHDFKSFASAADTRQSSVRTVF